MTTYEAIMIAEGVQPSTEEIYIEAWQYLIDSGACWNLQGWFGRQASAGEVAHANSVLKKATHFCLPKDANQPR